MLRHYDFHKGRVHRLNGGSTSVNGNAMLEQALEARNATTTSSVFVKYLNAFCYRKRIYRYFGNQRL